MTEIQDTQILDTLERGLGVLCVGDLEVDLGTREVRRDQTPIELPNLTYQLFLALMQAAPNVLTLDELIERVWPGRVVSPETVTQRIRLLRRALGDDAQSPTYVGLVRGQGYRLLVDVRSADETGSTGSLLEELTQRRVLQVAAMYVVVAWTFTEAATFVIESLGVFPEGAVQIVAILFVLGFPLTVFLAWRFDLTGDGGIRRAAATRQGKRTMATAFVLLIGTTTGLYLLIDPRAVDGDSAQVTSNSVAVLPFNNASGSQDDQYISDGLGDELRDQLGRVAGLQVAARSSSLFVHAQTMEAKQMAERLGVRWLIESTFRKQGDRLRISVQIIDGKTGFQRWSKAFDKLQSDLLSAQQDIAMEVVTQILPSAAGDVSLASAGSSNVSSQTLMLLARHLELQVRDSPLVDSEKLKRAITLYLQATEADPNAALAHSRLGGALLYSGDTQAAIVPIRRALELNPNLSDAHYALGLYHWMRQEPQAGPAYEKAVALNPNNPEAIAAHAKWLWNNNVVNKAGELLERARKLDPLSLERYSDLGNYYGLMNRKEDALAIAKDVERLFPNVPGYRLLTRIYEVTGDLDEAIAWAIKAKKAEPNLVDVDWRLAELYTRIGDSDSAMAYQPESSVAQLFFSRRYAELIDLSEELIIEHPDDLHLYYRLAFAYSTKGYHSQAIRLLRLIGIPERVIADGRATGIEAAVTYAGSLLQTGQIEEAQELLRWLNKKIQTAIDTGAAGAWWPNVYQACVLGYQGRVELMYKHLQRVPESTGLAWYPILKDAGCFQPHIADQRFIDVIEAVETKRSAQREKLPLTLVRHDVVDATP